MTHCMIFLSYFVLFLLFFFFFCSTTPESDLWIVKPPAGNNGHGVHVINGNAFWNGALTEDTNECCVQQYIRDPLLIRGAKVLAYLIFKNKKVTIFPCKIIAKYFLGMWHLAPI